MGASTPSLNEEGVTRVRSERSRFAECEKVDVAFVVKVGETTRELDHCTPFLDPIVGPPPIPDGKPESLKGVPLDTPNGDMAALTGFGAHEAWACRTCAVERHALDLG